MRILLAVAALSLWQAARPESVAKSRFADLKSPAPADARSTPLEGARSLSCAECHAEVTAEWSTTLHARAWVDEVYREELLDVRRPESCHNCHIPEPLHLQAGADGELPQKPKPRDATARDAPVADVDAHFGVSCETCHRGPEGTILGPWGLPTDAHVSKKHRSFLPGSSSGLCVACHATTVGPVIGIAKDFVDTEQARKGKSCVACHMAAVERPAKVEDGKELTPARAGRSHALQTPRDPSFLARALEITVARRGDKTVVVVANACGHRVPGRIGRSITLACELLDASGAVVARGSHAIETKKSLPADGTIEIELAGTGREVRVVGTHSAPALPDDVEFLDARFVVP